MDYEEIELNNVSFLEYTAIKIKTEGTGLLVINVYLPDYSHKVSLIDLKELLEFVNHKYHRDEVILLGDFNFPNIVWYFELDEPGYSQTWEETVFS